MPKEKEDKKKQLFKKIRNIVIGLVLILIMIKVSRVVFFVILFSVFVFIGKQIRGQFGLKLIYLDPLLFLTIMLAKFVDFKTMIIFVALNTLIFDAVTALISDGTFFNFGFYCIAAYIGVSLFGHTDNMMIYGNIASLIYSAEYMIYRLFIMPQDPMGSTVKAGSSFFFNFLYMTFFGPLIKLLMTI